MKRSFFHFVRVLILALLFSTLGSVALAQTPAECVANITKRLDALGVQKEDFGFLKAREIMKQFDYGEISAAVADSGKATAFKRTFTSLSEFCDLCGASLSAKGMKGYTRFSGGIILATGTDYVDYLKKIFGSPLPDFDGVGFNRVMEYLDSNGTWVNQTRWQSKGGQLFFDKGGKEGHRISHLLTHTQPGYGSPPHSVFIGMRDQMFDLLDEGWNKPPSARVQGLRKDGSPDPRAWVVDLGKVVGTGGQTKIRYIIESGTTGDLISAYPVFDLMP